MAKVLIVDDEASLRDLLQRFLLRQGHEVESAASPAAAWAAFEGDPEKFQVVVTDLSFDGENGEDLLERMRKKNPRLGGILTSGYPHRPRLAGVAFLQKPFMPQALAAALQQALNGTQG